MRAEEGGNRSNLGCITQGQNGKHFNILIPITEEWEQEFIKRNNIELCELYYEPYNFDRTGCSFCPYSKDLQEQLDRMKQLDKSTYNQAQIIWKHVYEEYRRIGYRLRKKKDYEQISIFDILNEE